MDTESAAWETAYRHKRALWAESSVSLPEMTPGARVLELGCGNAGAFASLIKKGYDAIALDFSLTATQAAQAVLRDQEKGNALLADARSIPLLPSSCDMVIARHIIGHMKEPDRTGIAREIRRIKKPDGLVIFTGFSREDFRYNRGTCLEEGTFLRGTGISTHYFTEDEVRSLFAPLSCRGITTCRWEIKIRGKQYPRAEIHAVFSQ